MIFTPGTNYFPHELVLEWARTILKSALPQREIQEQALKKIVLKRWKVVEMTPLNRFQFSANTNKSKKRVQV